MSPAEIALRMVSTARACHAASTRARIAQRGTLGGAGQPTPAAASMTRVVENICTRGRPSHGDCVGMQSKSEAASCATSTSTPDAPRAKAAAAASRKAELASAGVAAESSDNSCRNSRARRLRRPRSTCPAADTNAAKGSSAAQAPCETRRDGTGARRPLEPPEVPSGGTRPGRPPHLEGRGQGWRGEHGVGRIL